MHPCRPSRHSPLLCLFGFCDWRMQCRLPLGEIPRQARSALRRTQRLSLCNPLTGRGLTSRHGKRLPCPPAGACGGFALCRVRISGTSESAVCQSDAKKSASQSEITCRKAAYLAHIMPSRRFHPKSHTQPAYRQRRQTNILRMHSGPSHTAHAEDVSFPGQTRKSGEPSGTEEPSPQRKHHLIQRLIQRNQITAPRGINGSNIAHQDDHHFAILLKQPSCFVISRCGG